MIEAHRTTGQYREEPRGYAGIGRRAGPRSLWEKSRESSSLSIRTIQLNNMLFWWNGIHVKLKPLCRKDCGFESHGEHATKYGSVVELVYTLVLETNAARIEGSTPFGATR